MSEHDIEHPALVALHDEMRDAIKADPLEDRWLPDSYQRTEAEIRALIAAASLPPDVRGALQEAVLVLRGGGRLSGGQVTRIARHFGLKDPAHRDEGTEP